MIGDRIKDYLLKSDPCLLTSDKKDDVMKFSKRFKSIALVVIFTFTFQTIWIPNMVMASTQSDISSSLTNSILAFGEKMKDVSDTLRAIKDGLIKREDITHLTNTIEEKLTKLLSFRNIVETKLAETGNV